MKYDVEADWLLLTTCNFRCSYCFFNNKLRQESIHRHGNTEQWSEGFKATGKTWLIHITGGEPTLYPDFIDLCDRLSSNHFLSINSNLSHERIEEFAKIIDPERVHFVNSAVHIEERQKRSDLSIFIRRVNMLISARFKVLVSVVMTPYVVENYKEISQQFNDNGISLIPKIIRGFHNGELYPAAYTSEDKKLIRKYIKIATKDYMALLQSMKEPPTVDILSDARLIHGLKNYHGSSCAAGQKFVKIVPDGTVLLCNSGETLGNVLKKSVSLLNGPKICNTHYCPYFCKKYTAYEIY